MKKEWKIPAIKSISLGNTQTEDDYCGETKAKCLCGYYHFRLAGGCGGCQAPNYTCVITDRKPFFTKQCTCNSARIS